MRGAHVDAPRFSQEKITGLNSVSPSGDTFLSYENRLYACAVPDTVADIRESKCDSLKKYYGLQIDFVYGHYLA